MQPKPIYPRAARGIAIAAMLTFATAGSAAAAGPGYGGGGSPPPVTPTGFSSVLTAQTVTNQGGSFKIKDANGTIKVKVPKDATNTPIQIAITKGSDSTVKADLPGSLKRYKIVSSFGIEVRNGSSAASTTKPVKITLSAGDLKKGDVILVYNPATGKFTKLTGAIVHNGKVTIHLKSGESLAVASPPRHG